MLKLREDLTSQIVKSAGVVGLSTLLSRILGMVRDMVMSSIFGTTMVAEAFYVAQMLPNLLRRLVGEGALTVAFISVFTKLKQEEGEDAARRFAASFWLLMMVVLAALTVLGMVFSREIVYVFTNPDYRAKTEQFELAVYMTRWMFPYLFFIGLTALAMGIMNSYKRFFEPAFAPVLLNLAMIGCVIGLHNPLNDTGLSAVIGFLIGGVLQLLLQMPFLLKVSRACWIKINLRHPALKRIGAMMGPSTFAVGIIQINTLIATYFITGFDGGRSQLYYSTRLTEFPFAIFTLAIATVVLPHLSEQAGKGDKSALASTLASGLKLTGFVMIPASIGLAAIASPVIQVIYQHGEFTTTDTADTALMLIMACSGMWAVTGQRIVVQAFYAVEDTVTPLWSAAIAMVVNIAGCWLLAGLLGRAGVPLAIAIAAVVNFLILYALLGRKVVTLDHRDVIRTAGLQLLASLPMAALIIGLNQLPVWTQPGRTLVKAPLLLGEVALGAVLYFAVAHSLKIPQTHDLIEILKKRLRRKG